MSRAEAVAALDAFLNGTGEAVPAETSVEPATRAPAANMAQGTSANGSVVPPNRADEFSRTINEALIRTGQGSAMK